MITFNYETPFALENEKELSNWIKKIIESEGCKTGDIHFIFCDDTYLHKLNVEFLKHDTYTDIISFEYNVGKILHGDIFISIERVQENAQHYGVTFQNELHRVIIHGILHLCGYKDKTEQDAKLMRAKENACLKRLNTI